MMTYSSNKPTGTPPAIVQDEEDQVASVLNQHHPITEDLSIEPDPQLSGYQDDYATGDDEDLVEEAQGTSPAAVTLMPEAELKDELDKLAFDEPLANDPDDDFADARREQLEDIDEDDKDRE